LKRDGSALVETGTHDLGTGTYTVMQQVAADRGIELTAAPKGTV
jgi:CO/xanthine dehydrogenase Mo-binding subunit